MSVDVVRRSVRHTLEWGWFIGRLLISSIHVNITWLPFARIRISIDWICQVFTCANARCLVWSVKHTKYRSTQSLQTNRKSVYTFRRLHILGEYLLQAQNALLLLRMSTVNVPLCAYTLCMCSSCLSHAFGGIVVVYLLMCCYSALGSV